MTNIPRPRIAERMKDISHSQTNKFMIKNGKVAESHTMTEGINI